VKLHNFFRSSTSTRLRVALNLKGLDYDYVSYSLRDGETRTPAYLALNPAGLVPTIETEDGQVLTQSLAIMEWLDEMYPDPPLLPRDLAGRAHARALAYMIACEIHPLNNLRVLQHLTTALSASDAQVAEWFTHWVRETFGPLEQILARHPGTGTYCCGEQPGLADICLYAQVWNNRRFDIGMEDYPTIKRIFLALDQLDTFQRAAPPRQPDAT